MTVSGISKQSLGEFFGKDKEVNQSILREFCDRLNFQD